MEKMQVKTGEAKKTVLVAISDPALQYKYSSRLAAEGFNVANVSEASACLDALRCRAFDILVVELKLPMGGGEGIIRVMNKDSQIQTIPAVIIELPDDLTIDRGRGESVPFALEELVRVIKSRLHHSAY